MSMWRKLLASSPRPTYAYLAESLSTANNTTYNFTSFNFGTVKSSRIICVYVAGSKLTVNPAISSVTIGGVTASLAVAAGDTDFPTAIYYAAVPTGTSGTISVVWNQTVDTCGIGAYALYDVGSAPKASGGKSTSTAFPSISFLPNDIGLFFDWPGVAATWTNATENYDAPPNNTTGASYQAASALSRTVSNNYSGATYGAYAVWGAKR